jgi:hypothetical protein
LPKELTQERFANAADFTFFFVGNIDMEKDIAAHAEVFGKFKRPYKGS